VATCVSLLSLICMFRFLGAGNGTYNVSGRTTGQSTNLDTMLLPYAALGFALILLALYLFASSLFRRGNSRKPPSDIERRPKLSFQPNLGKGNKPPGAMVRDAGGNIAIRQRFSRVLKPTDRLRGEPVDANDARKGTKSDRTKQ
jgi:hypothetical protein